MWIKTRNNRNHAEQFAVGSVAQSKEEDWHYATPELDEAVASVALGLDGTCMLTRTEVGQGAQHACGKASAEARCAAARLDGKVGRGGPAGRALA
jgi:hypothetical protein